MFGHLSEDVPLDQHLERGGRAERRRGEESGGEERRERERERWQHHVLTYMRYPTQQFTTIQRTVKF
jgi:hypothetical protein